ncbi:AtpZ/AtpI family protein [Rubripirellula tenax]|uniref:AtpZ/AtpI family protein n=1 Tax=Rubripirellula tenax TaxID=2528015 RepID=UPI001644388D|nr:AtpZ/AtpI family protein [Rubripirellula tenax]
MSAGLELSGVSLGMAAVGYGFDRYFDSSRPIATAIGLLIGFSFGMFRFIQRATSANDAS